MLGLDAVVVRPVPVAAGRESSAGPPSAPGTPCSSPESVSTRVGATTVRPCSSTCSSTYRPSTPPSRARELVDAGAAGLFTFEGPHDVFLPLAAAAASGVETDLMTNVAIAMPRSPMHLAHAAHDLQRMSGGRFRLGLGSQVRPHIEKRYGATWSPPAARMREIVLAVKAILGAWQDGTRLDFRGEHTRHTLMPPTFVPGPAGVGTAAGAARRARAGDDPDRGRGGRRAAGDAVPQPPARPRAHPARDRGGARPGAPIRAAFAVYPQAIVAMGRTADAARRRHPRRPRAAGVLRLHAGVPPGPRRRGLGRPPARAQRALQDRRRTRR